MKLSDYVMRFLVERKIEDLFVVSGGGIMHLLDALGRSGIRYHCNYHEQACVISAEGYARITGKPGAVLVTVGPGASNAVSALPGAWVDSIPEIVLTGQVRRDLIADYSRLRQLGPQEANTLDMARPVTKYSARVLDPHRIRHELEAAYHHATSGRPGPVWLELPLDVQNAELGDAPLDSFSPPASDVSNIAALVGDVVNEVHAARRPIIVAGNGIRLSGSHRLFMEMLRVCQIPVVVPFTAKDLIAEDHLLNVGVFGTAGQRRANFAVQNADCLIALGAGLNCQKVGFNYAGFAPKATKIIVDIDETQLHHQVLKADIAVQCDVRSFIEEFLAQFGRAPAPPRTKWLSVCQSWKERYPVITPDFFLDPDHVNSYVFVDKLSDFLSPDDVVVAGAGLDAPSYYQAFRVKEGQRTLLGGWGSMGWDLPLAFGACVGSGMRRTICITGDGSIQWNIQELMTIAKHRAPIKIFVFNNKGFACIRATQDNFYQGKYVASDFGSGIGNPDFKTLALAYGLPYFSVGRNSEIADVLGAMLKDEGAAICELNIAPEQGISPKASSFRRPDGSFESRPLEDMAPFLPREEIFENMHFFDDEDVTAPQGSK